MTSILPRLKLHYYRYDGDGNLDLVVVTSKGEREIRTLNDDEVAAVLRVTAAYCESRFRRAHERNQALMQLAGHS